MLLKLLESISQLAIPFMIVGIIAYGLKKNVKVYDAFVEGAKGGFATFIRILPSFVAMLVAIGVFRESGALDLLTKTLRPIVKTVNIPEEVVPMMIMRPLSGSGAQSIISQLARTYGPESLACRTAAVMMGSSETTLYVLAIYFGSISIKKQRHALASGLIADLVGFLSAVYVSRIFFNS